MLSGELGGGGRSVDRYGLIDGFATSIVAAPRTLDGQTRTEGPWDGGTDTDFGGRGTGRVARQQRKEREEEGGREGYVQKGTEGRKAAVSTAACARGGTNGYRAIDE